MQNPVKLIDPNGMFVSNGPGDGEKDKEESEQYGGGYANPLGEVVVTAGEEVGENPNSTWTSEVTVYSTNLTMEQWQERTGNVFSTDPGLAFSQWETAYGDDYLHSIDEYRRAVWNYESALKLMAFIPWASMMWGMGANFNLPTRGGFTNVSNRSFSLKGARIRAAANGMSEINLLTRAAQKAEAAVGGTGRFAGISKHTYANKLLGRYQSIYGNRGLEFNNYFNNGIGNRGFLDVVNHGSKNIYDFKFGSATWRSGQLLKYQRNFPGYNIQIIRP